MATTADQLDLADNLQPFLARLRSRIRTYILLEGAAVAVIWVVAMFWFALALDFLPVRLGATEMPIIARGLLLAITFAGLCYILHRWIVRRIFTPLPDRSMALLLERYNRPFADSLLTAVELRDRQIDMPEFSKQMLARTSKQARDNVAHVRLASVFNYRSLAIKLVAAILLAVSVLGLLTINAGAFETATKRLYLLSDSPWPRSAVIEVVGIDIQRPGATAEEGPQTYAVEFQNRLVKVARGSNVSLKVRARADALVVPDSCTIQYRAENIDGSGVERGSVVMSNFREQTDWRNFWFNAKPFKGVLATIDFDVVGYDHRQSGYRLEVVDSPAVVDTLLDLDFPSYMVDEALSGHLPVRGQQYLPSGTFVPVGTKVLLTFRANKPLLRAEILNVETQERQVVDVGEGSADRQQFSYGIESLAGSATLEVSLVDVDNVAIERPHRVFLTAVDDQPPQIESTLKGIGTAVTPDVLIPLTGKVSDDYSVERTWLEVQINDSGDPQQISARLTNGDALDAQLDFRQMRTEKDAPQLKPTDKLLLSVKATDRYNLGSEPHVGVGDRYQLDVVTPSELLSQLEVRELGLRRRFEQILDEMTQLRDSLLRVKASLQSEDKAGAEPEDLRPDEEGGQALSPAQIAQRTAELRLLRVQRGLQQSQKSVQEVLGVAAGFAGIREELINNRVDTEERKERLKEQIADPLTAICSTRFPKLDESLTTFEKSLGLADDASKFAAEADQVVDQANATIAELDAVLQKMLDLETYNELLDIVRDIMSEQQKLIDRTKQERKRQVLEDLK